MRRLYNQWLTGPAFARAGDVVRWLGAVPAQEHVGAKWALAQGMIPMTSAALDRTLASGEITRTHLLRPTWHVVAPDDPRRWGVPT